MFRGSLKALLNTALIIACVASVLVITVAIAERSGFFIRSDIPTTQRDSPTEFINIRLTAESREPITNLTLINADNPEEKVSTCFKEIRVSVHWRTFRVSVNNKELRRTFDLTDEDIRRGFKEYHLSLADLK